MIICRHIVTLSQCNIKVVVVLVGDGIRIYNNFNYYIFMMGIGCIVDGAYCCKVAKWRCGNRKMRILPVIGEK